MAARAQGSRNNLLAGAFVIASLVLAVAMSAWVAGAFEHLSPSTPYVFRVPLRDGAAGVSAGSPVLLGGQPVGRVTSVRVHTEPGPRGEPQPVGIDLRVRVRADVPLYEDAWATIVQPLLGSGGSVNISWTGDGTRVPIVQGTSTRLERNEVLPATLAPPPFLAAAGYGPTEADAIKTTIRNVAELSQRLNSIVGQVNDKVRPTMDLVLETATDARQVVGDVRGRSPEWLARIDRVLASADDATEDLPALVEESRARLAEARTVISETGSMIEEARPEVRATLQSIRSAAERFEATSLPLAERALDDARTGSAEFARLTESLSRLLAEQTPGVRTMPGNGRLASDQLKLAAIEVRRNPWRLLYQPRRKELESEVFFDAARSYAQAVSDLRAASESLESLAAGNLAPADSETIREMTRHMAEMFQRYQDAERRLLDAIAERSG
jgi:ABC-type transporter Mla subunit MlaD